MPATGGRPVSTAPTGESSGPGMATTGTARRRRGWGRRRRRRGRGSRLRGRRPHIAHVRRSALAGGRWRGPAGANHRDGEDIGRRRGGSTKHPAPGRGGFLAHGDSRRRGIEASLMRPWRGAREAKAAVIGGQGRLAAVDCIRGRRELGLGMAPVGREAGVDAGLGRHGCG